ncbi:MAG: FKBP-type peptidyl-prolyl cis-trans isomerase [Eubacterium sp.]
MTKRILAILLSIALVATMAGCNKKNESTGEVKLGTYTGLEAYEAEVEVSDDDWQSTLSGIIEKNTTTEDVTKGTVEEGDSVNISYVGKLPSMDDYEFEGGTASNYQLYVGQSGFIDGFDDGLIGKDIGSTFDLNLTFPDNYEQTTKDADGNELVLAGLDVIFTVTINSKSVSTEPEYNDEFVKEKYGYYGVSTTDEFEEYVRGELRKYNIIEAIWDELVDGCEVVAYDDDEVQSEVDYYNNYYESQYKSQYGVDLDTYLGAVGYDRDDWDADVLEYAKSTIKEKMIVRAIADAENLNPDKKTYEKYATIYMHEYSYDSIDALEEAMGEDEVEYAVIYVIVQDFLCENTTILEGERPTEENTEEDTDEASSDDTGETEASDKESEE